MQAAPKPKPPSCPQGGRPTAALSFFSETTMQEEAQTPSARRGFLKAAAGTGLAALGGAAGAQSFDFKPSERYPDPAVQILDPGFGKYRIYSSTVEQIGSGLRWAEGPVWFG